MGILNVTPDSFYDGGKFFSEQKAVERVKEMIEEGADIIDIGGQSTRPGSSLVTTEEELARVIPVIERVNEKVFIPISIDTSNPIVAEEALKKGASIVNDITALNGDPAMAGIVAKYNAGIILMHMKGTPQTMQDNPVYEDVINEIFEYLKRSVNKAISAGINPDAIIIDPGIGFGKTVEHNLLIVNRLKEFKELKKPILIGVSRKSFIGKVLKRDAENRIFGTAAACALAVANGAEIIRVHDVREMKDIAAMSDAVLKEREIL